MAKRPWFSGPLTRYAMGRIHVSPFDRSNKPIDAVRTMLGLLDRDQAVMVFPEGHRSPDHTMQEGMLGVVYVAMKSQAPILPVGADRHGEASGLADASAVMPPDRQHWPAVYPAGVGRPAQQGSDAQHPGHDYGPHRRPVASRNTAELYASAVSAPTPGCPEREPVLRLQPTTNDPAPD